MIESRILRPVLIAVTLLAAGGAPSYAQLAGADPGTEYEGVQALGLTMRRLGQTARVLHIGAHPDDENTSLLSTLALGRGVDVAYLALTRGEGGQNGIGPELQEALGLIRSEELLAARRLDGAVQFFTRAYDFGYSKSAEEAFRHWPRDEILADVVAVIRHYRPDAVVSVFSGTPRDGHGQHQVAGILAREAVVAAADPTRFPDRGPPHAVARFYRSSWFLREGATHELATGQLDPLLGRSYHQAAMASRSRHRSQDMGVPQRPGPRTTSLIHTDPETGEPVPQPADDGAGLFAGIPTTLTERARALADTGDAPRPEAWADIIARLERYRDRIAEARTSLNALAPHRAVPPLLAARTALVGALERLGPDMAGEPLRFHIAGELRDLDAATLRAAGIVVEVVSDDDRVVPGRSFELTLRVWNGGRRRIRVAALEPRLPAGWTAAADPVPDSAVAPGAMLQRVFTVTAPAGAERTRPYFLERPRDGDIYRWPPDRVVGVPFERDAVRGMADIAVEGARIRAERPARYVGVDPNRGEFRRPVLVVPEASVRLEPQLAVLPADAVGERPLAFEARVTGEAPLAGTLRLEAPSGWRVEPASVAVDMSGAGGEQVTAFRVRPDPGDGGGDHRVRAVLETKTGARYDSGYDLVDYPHIAPHALYREAAATVRSVDVRLPAELRVGYIDGAGDGVPDLLDQLGVPVEHLTEAELAGGDLDRFDIIVTGIRAYEVRPDLVKHNDRVLRYVERGGTLLVQYNKYAFPRGDYAPYPVTIARPHDRVTDETAPVTVLRPEHRVFNRPNEITARDFEGWVQERGLYFLHEWDPAFEPLLEMSDFGEPPVRGALLIAPYGAGTYVYTGLAFFRQIPAGVPGAIRLFANLIALGAP